MKEDKETAQQAAAQAEEAKAAGTAQETEKQEAETDSQESVEEAVKDTAEAEEKAAEEQGLDVELEKLRLQVAEENDKYVRLMAEFDNYRRRTAKERIELIETASKDVLEGFLPVVDDFERALEALAKTEGAEAAVEGTQLIYNKLTAYLKSKGLTRIEAKGEEFNTDFHEAVAQFPAPSDDMKNKIIDVVQQGYMLGGKVVRFAKVVVGI